MESFEGVLDLLGCHGADYGHHSADVEAVEQVLSTEID